MSKKFHLLSAEISVKSKITGIFFRYEGITLTAVAFSRMLMWRMCSVSHVSVFSFHLSFCETHCYINFFLPFLTDYCGLLAHFSTKLIPSFFYHELACQSPNKAFCHQSLLRECESVCDYCGQSESLVIGNCLFDRVYYDLPSPPMMVSLVMRADPVLHVSQYWTGDVHRMRAMRYHLSWFWQPRNVSSAIWKGWACLYMLR